MQIYIEAFIPLFVAMNLPGVLPLFIGLTDGMTISARRKLVVQAVLTALLVALCVLFAGRLIFETLGITLNDLRVGGGIILLLLSVTDIVFSDFRRRMPDGENSLGIVPVGIPLVIGPAAITTILVSQQTYSYLPTLAALLLNLLLVLVAFFYGPSLLQKFGSTAAKAVGKVASLFLAAIAVAMIRAGIEGMIL